jgi:hypothetical protein
VGLLVESRKIEISGAFLWPYQIPHRRERRADQETERRAVRVDVNLDGDICGNFVRSQTACGNGQKGAAQHRAAEASRG